MFGFFANLSSLKRCQNSFNGVAIAEEFTVYAFNVLYACTVYVQCGLLYNQEPRYIMLESVM